MVYYYLSAKEKEKYSNFYSSKHLKEKLDVEIVKNGIIVGYYNENDNYWQSAGIFDENKCVIPHLTRCSCVALAQHIPSEPVKINKTAIFLGSLNKRWGHFILESLSTLWYLLDNDYSDFDLVVNVADDFPEEFFDFYELFGISRDKLVINKGVLQYNEIIVPELSFKLNNYYSDEYNQVIKRITSSIEPIINDKIYFSREKYNNGNFFGESEISTIFKENGYKIFYPEQLSVAEQIGLLKGCKSFACLNGSCAHNLIFAEDNIEAIILERYSEGNNTQAMINIMKNFKTYYVNSHYTFLPVASGWGPFILGVNSFNSKFFKDKNFNYDEKMAEKINDYIIPFLAKWQMILKNSKGAIKCIPVDSNAILAIEKLLNIVFVEGRMSFVDKLIENTQKE